MPYLRLLVVGGLLLLVGAQAERDKRGYATSRLVLDIDNVGSAAVSSITGGNVTADVVAEPVTGKGVAGKRLGQTRIVPVTVEVAAGDLAPWISQTLSGTALKVNGRILELDANNSVVAERQFTNATLTEFTLPALDASSREPARMKLTFQPEAITTKSGGGAKAPALSDAKAKRPLASAFRVTIPGVDCTGVAKVEPITITFKLVSAASGTDRTSQKNIGETVAGDLVLTVADAKAGGFVQWHDQAVVRGDATGAEKTATVELLTPDLKTAILTLEGQGVGIVTVRPPAMPAGAADQARRVEAQMYVEQWRVK